MNTFQDDNGLEYSASTRNSVTRFDELVSSFMGYRPEAGRQLKALLEADSDMPMALCMKGYFAKMMGLRKLHGRAQGLADQLSADNRADTFNHRESLHVEALGAWCSGDLDRTVRIWEDILLRYPQDCIALRLAYFNHFYSGDGRRMRDSVARVLPFWEPSHPRYGYILGLYAFALEECGEYALAERHGRQAVEINPTDAWAVHAVAHVMEAQERHQEGIDWLAGLEPHWSTANNFRFHLYWHQCLYHLDKGEYDAALDIHDRLLVSDLDSDFYLDLCNAASLLWRLELHGVEIEGRWEVLLEAARRRIEDRDLVFASLHYLMVLIAAGGRKSGDAWMDNFRQWAASGDTQGRVMLRVGTALATAMRDLRQGRPDRAYETFSRIRYEVDLIGGSVAQRDLFGMLLIEAASRAECHHETRALCAERVALRPRSRWTWLRYSQALHATRDRVRAKEAADHAMRLHPDHHR
ncbi:MAG: tetratricopeptide repeat protein [Gammaproteobacteria bacterium]|nr:tetratricopeptide repeat protein [Gammaproteobacteria bacterium]MYD77226.1 tetratricopeptide repeat protein [Gammaproteobacteria bacterium]MYJ53241.1 tetratricopeptide repeat protein [Gammaproteobacteria bacterium]